jgi:hypothetical protein
MNLILNLFHIPPAFHELGDLLNSGSYPAFEPAAIMHHDASVRRVRNSYINVVVSRNVMTNSCLRIHVGMILFIRASS